MYKIFLFNAIGCIWHLATSAHVEDSPAFFPVFSKKAGEAAASQERKNERTGQAIIYTAGRLLVVQIPAIPVSS